MGSTLRRILGVGIVAATLAACGSGSDSDGRDRNVEAGFTCAQGGACVLGDVGPGGGTVFVAADKGGTAWEAAPLNGYGSYGDAVVLVRQLDFGGKSDWVLPPDTLIDDLWAQRDQFLCPADTDCPDVFADGSYWAQGKNAESGTVWSFSTGVKVDSENDDQNFYRPVRPIVIAGATTTTGATTSTSTSTSTTVARTTTTSSTSTSTSTTVPRTMPTIPNSAPSGKKCKVSYSSYTVEFCQTVSQVTFTYGQGGVYSLGTTSASLGNSSKLKAIQTARDKQFTSLKISVVFTDGSRLSDVIFTVAYNSSGETEFTLS